jgi:hypothetical protein
MKWTFALWVLCISGQAFASYEDQVELEEPDTEPRIQFRDETAPVEDALHSVSVVRFHIDEEDEKAQSPVPQITLKTESLQHDAAVSVDQANNISYERGQNPCFVISDSQIFRGLMTTLGMVTNLFQSYIIKTDVFTLIFASSPFSNNFLAVLIGATGFGSLVSIFIYVYAPIDIHRNSIKLILISSYGGLLTTIFWMIFPSIITNYALSPQERMGICVVACFLGGTFFGSVAIGTFVLASSLHTHYSSAFIGGYTLAEIFSSLFYIIEASKRGLPETEGLGPIDPSAILNANYSNSSFASNLTSVSLSDSQKVVIPNSIYAQYMIVVGFSCTAVLSTVILAQLSSGLSLEPKIPDLLRHGTRNTLHLPSMSLKLPFSANSIILPLGSIQILSTLIETAIIMAVYPLVVANVAAVSPDPGNVFKTNMFTPTSIFLTCLFASIGAFLVDKKFSVLENPWRLPFLSIPLVLGSLLLLLCNFKRSSSSSGTVDPFKNAPRYINSDIAYFSILSLYSLFAGYIRGIIVRTGMRHMKKDMPYAKLGRHILVAHQFGLVIGSMIALLLQSSLCGCSPFKKF